MWLRCAAADIVAACRSCTYLLVAPAYEQEWTLICIYRATASAVAVAAAATAATDATAAAAAVAVAVAAAAIEAAAMLQS